MTAAATMTPITTLGKPLLFLDVSLAVLFALFAVWVIIVVERAELDDGVGVATTGGGVVTTSAVVRVDVDVLVERVLLVVVLVERVLVDRVEDLVDVVVGSSSIPPKIPERIMEIMSPSSSGGSAGATGVGGPRPCLASICRMASRASKWPGATIMIE